MAVPFSNTKLRVPKGFQNILECLAREVLRAQPDNIHEFAASYFEKLLKVRSETGHDPAVHGASLEDRNYNNEAFKRRDVDPSDPQQNEAATKIQTQFRQHSAKEEVAEMKEEMAAMRIQAGFRGYLDREQVREMKTKSEDGDGVAADEEEVDIDLEDPEVEKAAIKIQAGFKGFKARKEVQEKTPEKPQEEETQGESTQALTEVTEQKPAEEEIDIDLEDPATEKAALKIQAGFRGYQTRKDISGTAGEAEVTEEKEKVEETADKAEAPEEEVIDIDLNDPEVEKAATKIQAGFKGLKTRKEVKEMKEKTQAEGEQGGSEDQVDATPVAVQQESAEGMAAPEVEVATDEGQTAAEEPLKEEPAAAEQATEQPAEQTAEKPAEQPAAEEPAADQPSEEAPAQATEGEKAGGAGVDIDMDDPNVEHAAVKIQAGFKGMKSRREVKAMREEAKKSKGEEEGGDDKAGGQEAEEAKEEEGGKVEEGQKGEETENAQGQTVSGQEGTEQAEAEKGEETPQENEQQERE